MSDKESLFERDHFYHIFWFIVGLCSFGAFLTIFLIMYLPIEEAKRVADTALIFWLSTAVSGGIGYLIGNAVSKQQIRSQGNGLQNVDLTLTASSDASNTKENDKTE